MTDIEWIEHFSGFNYAIERIWNNEPQFLNPKQLLETSSISLFGFLNAFDRGLSNVEGKNRFLLEEIIIKENYGEVKNATLVYSSSPSRTVAILTFDADGFLTYRIHMAAIGNIDQ